MSETIQYLEYVKIIWKKPLILQPFIFPDHYLTYLKLSIQEQSVKTSNTSETTKRGNYEVLIVPNCDFWTYFPYIPKQDFSNCVYCVFQ